MGEIKKGKDEVLMDLVRAVLSSGEGESDSVRRVSLASQLALIYSTFRMVNQIQDLLEFSEKVVERIKEEDVLNKMSPRTLVEALKAVSDVMNKYASLSASVGKDLDISEVEASLLETMARSRTSSQGEEEMSRYTKEELAEKILEIAEKMKNIN
jgi:hypothetical protein